MWREVITGLFEGVTFQRPANASQIAGVEATFNVKLPDEIRSLLMESNGVAAHYGLSLVWSTDEIMEQNLLFRRSSDFANLYMPFDCLLFIGAAGNGHQFAYRILGGQIRDTSEIYEWDHESDNREWFARDLKDYVERSVPRDE